MGEYIILLLVTEKAALTYVEEQVRVYFFKPQFFILFSFHL